MGVYLSQPNTQKDSSDGHHKTIKFAYSSMQGWRTNMEDAHIAEVKVDDNVSLFGVFDGHGGKEVARYVADHLIEELKRNPAYQSRDYKKALEETFLRMDDLLNTDDGKRELSKIKNGGDGSDYKPQWQQESFAGCTANVALLVDCKTLYVANAGDSRTVLSRDGKALELSLDHKPENPIEKERVQKAGGFISEGRINGNLNLSRAIGDLEYKKNADLKPHEQLISAYPDVTITELTPEDEFILMGCDGIWETKSNQELVELCRSKIQKKETLRQTLEDLLDTILAPDTSNGFGCDNMTTIIVTFRDF